MCYRYEQVTARSEMQFNQVEGLVVGRNITMADLKGAFYEFARHMFGGSGEIRFRGVLLPVHRAERRDRCVFAARDTERNRMLTKGTGWLEISGAGMVHPTVLRNGGYDPDRVERLRLRHGCRSARPCACLASTTFATSGKTMCGFWSSFEDINKRTENSLFSCSNV